MKENRKRKQILNILAENVREYLLKENLDFAELQEIRLRTGKPLIIVYRNKERVLPAGGAEKYTVTREDVRETMDYVSHYSLYAYEEELSQGFLTIEGGHRVGVTGKVVLEGDKVKNIQYISSVNIRMAHEKIGCADRVLKHITKNREVCHTLIISPPRCGKTTLIRDIVRQISEGNDFVKGCTVGVVDERSEIGGCYQGVAQNQLGMRTDILDCCPKAQGMLMMIRSMAPQVLAIDEIGTCEEVRAVEYAMQYLGVPYVWGGNGPNCFDCSGLTKYVYGHFGYTLNRTASAQLSNGVSVSRSELQPGDLVFFDNGKVSTPVSHVGIYIGGNQFIHASSPSTGVIVSSMNDYVARGFVGACRIFS